MDLVGLEMGSFDWGGFALRDSKMPGIQGRLVSPLIGLQAKFYPLSSMKR
jgi:hypothetical protein